MRNKKYEIKKTVGDIENSKSEFNWKWHRSVGIFADI